MKKIKIIFVLLLQILIYLNVFAGRIEKLNYDVYYFGLPVAKVNILTIRKDTTISIISHTFSRGLIGSVFQINNRYISKCDSLYQPEKFEKHINQENIVESKIIEFTENNVCVKDFVEKEEYNMQCESMVFDLLSFLFHIRYDNFINKYFYCYGKLDIWGIAVNYIKNEELTYHKKRIDCKMYLAEFSQEIDSYADLSVDVLSNNLFRSNTKLYLWISKDSDRLPVKLKFKKFPFSVIMKLKNDNISYYDE